MTSPGGRLPRGPVCLWLVSVLACLWLVPGAAGAADLRVQGRTHIEMSVEAAGTRAIVKGRLVDDLGHALRQREIQLTARESPTDAGSTASVITRRGGRFRHTFELAPGNHQVQARFEATDHLSGASSTAGVELVAAEPTLSLRAPSWVAGQAANPTLRVGVTISGRGVGVQAEMTINDDEMVGVEVDEDGRARVPLGGRLRAGKNTIEVAVPDGALTEGLQIKRGGGEAATAEATIWYTPSPRLRTFADVGFSQFQRVVRVHGRLFDDAGGVPNAPIEVRLVQKGSGGEPVKTERRETERDGGFSVSFDATGLADGTYTARVAAVPDAGGTVSAETESATLDRSLTRSIVDGAAALAGLVVLVLLSWRGWQAWRAYRLRRRRDAERRRQREHAFETEETLEPVSVETDAGEAADASETAQPQRLRAQFWDEWRQKPVTRGQVRVAASRGDDAEETRRLDIDGDGRIEATLPAGRWEIEVDAPGFMPATNKVTIPHDGSLDGVRFELVAIPLKIRRLFESVTAMLSEEELWGTKTPREIETLLQDVLRDQTPSLPSVEQVDAAGRTPVADDSVAQTNFTDTQAGSVEETTTDEPAASDLGEAISRRFESTIADNDELESAEDYLHALTSILEEAYYSPRTYGRDVWEMARSIGRELKARADQTSDGGNT